MRTLFVIGSPRSGTTLMQQILGRHPEVVVPPETAFFTKLLSRWPGRFHRQLARIGGDLGIDLSGVQRPRGQAATAALFERLGRAYAERVGRTDARWLVEKTPDHLHHLDTIRATLPDARFLSMVRDGRAVARSLSRVPWAPDDPLVCFGVWLEAARLQVDLHRDPPPWLLPMRFEDLLHHPERQVRRLLEHLELDDEPGMLRPDGEPRGVPAHERGWKETAHGSIDEGRAEAWRDELAPQQLSKMERWGGGELAALGYEPLTGSAFDTSGGPGAVTRWRRARWRVRSLGRLLSGRD